MSLLPIMRPKLPSAQALLPYLGQIDASRIYSNFGPLSLQLEARLASRHGAPDGVTTVANGTLGLVLALLAQNARPGSLCVIPAWTFIASAQAAVLAGLVPFFVDVAPSTWTLDPDSVLRAINDAPGEVGAVMPVAPFGRPIAGAAWDRFSAATGLPVVIDAAAGFDSVTAALTPSVVSLHATKVLGVGEGGYVLSTNSAVIRGVRTRANFGFLGSRVAELPGLNAKLSEYHAAVGLAALDEWDTARSEWLAAAGAYRQRLIESGGVRVQDGFGKTWVSSVCVLDAGGPQAGQLEARLLEAGIETRRWWGSGAHIHRSTLQLPRTALPVTERLGGSTIAVPFFRDLEESEIDRVVNCVLTSKVQ